MAGSIALVGFGFDSLIEVTSGAALVWRLHSDADESRQQVLDLQLQTATHELEGCPTNVPQRSARRASKAHDAHDALAFSLSIFVSVENKGSLGYIPKLEVAGSIPVARSKFQLTNLLFPNLCTFAVCSLTTRQPWAYPHS
jgi:hypothetical protein